MGVITKKIVISENRAGRVGLESERKAALEGTIPRVQPDFVMRVVGRSLIFEAGVVPDANTHKGADFIRFVVGAERTARALRPLSF